MSAFIGGCYKLRLEKVAEKSAVGAKKAKAMDGLKNNADWVRNNDGLLNKLSTRTDEFMGKIDDFFKNKLQQPALPRRSPQGPPPYSASSTHPDINVRVDVEYDSYGFPKFEQYSPGSQSNSQSDNLLGNTVISINPHPDNDFANNDFISKFGSENIEVLNSTGSPVLLKVNGEWKKYTWHHHQDGLTMIPVPSSIHGISHTGGNATITRGLKGFFKGPFN